METPARRCGRLSPSTRNERHVTRLARRTSDHWAAFTATTGRPPRTTPKARRSDRYRAINTGNPDTFELRVFASSLDPCQVKAIFAFAAASVEYTRGLTAHTIVAHDGWDLGSVPDLARRPARVLAAAGRAGGTVMCLLTFLPAAVMPDLTALTNGAWINEDGHGFAIVTTDGLLVHRGMDAHEVIDAFANARGQHPSGPALFHSRLATHGDTTVDNCHPFPVGGDDRTVIAHNGILPRPSDHPKRIGVRTRGSPPSRSCLRSGRYGSAVTGFGCNGGWAPTTRWSSSPSTVASGNRPTSSTNPKASGTAASGTPTTTTCHPATTGCACGHISAESRTTSPAG